MDFRLFAINCLLEDDIAFIMYFGLTGEELKQMKKVLMIAPWTELDLGCDEKTK